jgi:hypothetical protein
MPVFRLFDMPKSIHVTKLWRGAVFALTINRIPQVWYHCDYIDDRVIHLTAIHSGQSYERQLYDRWVWLRP